MALVSRWDIREETYADGNTVTSLTDQIGTVDLAAIGATPLPSYNATEDAMYFDGTEVIGAAVSAGQDTALTSGSWALAVLTKRAAGTFNTTAFGFGDDSNTGYGAIQVAETGAPAMRAAVDDQNINFIEFNGPAITVDTWVVQWLRYDSAADLLYAGVDGSETTYDTSASTFAENWTLDRLTLGAGIRIAVENFFTGYIREARLYDSTETGNTASITTNMKDGPSSGSNTLPAEITATDGDTDVSVGGDPGFTGSLSEINLKVSDDSFSMSLAIGASSTESEPHFDMPDLLATAYETGWCPYTSASHAQLQIELVSDTAEVETVNLIRNLPTGRAVVELGSVVTTVGSAFYGVASPETVPPATSQLIYPTADTTSFDSTGLATTDKNGGFMDCWVWRSDTGNIEFTQVWFPGQLALSGLPATVGSSTTYSVTVDNGTSAAFSFYINYDGVDYECTVTNSDVTGFDLTTPSDVPSDTPTTNVRVAFLTP